MVFFCFKPLVSDIIILVAWSYMMFMYFCVRCVHYAAHSIHGTLSDNMELHIHVS